MNAMAPSLVWTDIGAGDDIAPRCARIVRTARGEVAIFRTAEDGFHAIDNRCPHRGGPLAEGIVHAGQVTCPLHSWVFDLASGQAQGADSGCVRVYPLRVQAGRLLLGLEPAE